MEVKDKIRNDMEKRLSTDRQEQGDSPPFRKRKAHSVELD